jgi:hypothetical protein
MQSVPYSLLGKKGGFKSMAYSEKYFNLTQYDKVYHLGNVCYRYAIEKEGLLLGTEDRTQWGPDGEKNFKNVGWIFGFVELADARRWAAHMAKHIKGSRELIAAYVVENQEPIWRQDPLCFGVSVTDYYQSAVMTNIQPSLEVSEVIPRFIDH